jgi:hypothetical protein
VNSDKAKEAIMPKHVEGEDGYRQVAIRIPVEFFTRIEAHLSRMRASSPGIDLKRSDAIRSLIAKGLALVERDAKA